MLPLESTRPIAAVISCLTALKSPISSISSKPITRPLFFGSVANSQPFSSAVWSTMFGALPPKTVIDASIALASSIIFPKFRIVSEENACGVRFALILNLLLILAIMYEFSVPEFSRSNPSITAVLIFAISAGDRVLS